MNHVPPMTFTWTDEGCFRPLNTRAADKHFVVGEQYRMEVREERSVQSHNHEFAFIADAFINLPEQYRLEPWAQSPEHLRKFALIRKGFCHAETFTCASNAEALRWAPRLRADDEYCVVRVDGSVVHRFRAESQSRRAMGAKRFQESKQAILDYLASLIGVEPDTLQREAGRAA